MIVSAKPGKLSLLLFLGSSFLQAGFYWALTIFISRHYPSESLGSYSYILALITPLFVLGSLQTRSYLLTQKSDPTLGELKWLRLLFPSLLFIVGFLYVIIFERNTVLLYLALAGIKWGELWSDLSYGKWQYHQGLQRVNQALITRYLFLLSILTLASFIKLKLETFLLILAMMSLIIGLVDYILCGLDKIPLRAKGSKTIFLTTLSLSASALLTALIVNIPRYQLKGFHSMEVVGSFTLLFYYYVIPSMILNYLCQGLLKEFKEIFGVKKRLLFYGFIILLVTAIYSGILFMLGEDFNHLVYKRKLLWNKEIIILISASVLIGNLSSLFHYVLMSKNIYSIQLKANLASSVITLVSGMILIREMGLIGAFLSFILGLLVQLITYAITFNRIKHE
jgi:O-antigen/teichoic acid export membrane protein